ncbi:energy transducer TonB [Lacihabitans sp. CS3-21]|uniref:energy transducer TonB family protein n=1 Tax=Lacihabitans sp. CS3-21 TaxID=2487332 RepID=UPI0020CDC5B3|nr:energy transducer TonB [Lacihabitans sp. CS3-21]MCP9745185.1 energy transducer TonB [Lacihabitans sp. CS3-21]
MKKLILGLLLSTTFLSGFAQDLAYEVRGKYLRTVTKDVLEHSNLLSDIIAGYPVNWVKEYVSVDVLTEKDGKTEIAKGENQVLNTEQKSILNKADLDSEVHINVHYKSINSGTERKENNEMVVKMTVVPDIQAEFEGGYENLKKYLKDNLIDRIIENTPPEFQKGKVVFKIDPNGKLVDAEILEPSGDTNMDNFLLEVFRNMPNWKPAQNATGEKVKQRFEFSMGIGGC